MTNIIFAEKEDAERVLDRMKDVFKRYGYVCVQDVHDLVGLPSTHIDSKMGWPNLDGMVVQETADGHFLINGPEAKYILCRGAS